MVTTAGPGVWSWLPDGRVAPISPVGQDGMWYQACVHPEGGHAVFWGGRDDDPAMIWRASTDRTDDAEVLGDSGGRHPAYGARGDRIVFTSDRLNAGNAGRTMRDEDLSGAPPVDRAWNLFTMSPEGNDVQQVTEGPHVDQRPALSPDGRKVAFVSDRGAGIWVVPADGSAPPEQIGSLPLYRPWWSIDGGSVLCFRLSRANRQVGRLDTSTGEWMPLPNDDLGNTHGPFADLRGDRVLAHSNRDGEFALWEIPLDGSQMVKVTPPGFEGRTHGHGTRARTGEVTFDEF